MDVVTIGILIIVLLLMQGIGLWFVFGRQKNSAEPDSSGGFVMLQQQMQELARTVDARVAESSKSMQSSLQHQLSESTKIVKDVTERLTKLDETNRQVMTFADQLQNLQDVLQNPKQRGILGEYYLETVLQNVLPPESFQMQYRFVNGEIVDAVVFVKERVIPIDAKFSLENYNRALEARDPAEKERYEKAFKTDLKARIDETSKYVRPEEKTLEFAFMFIPSEGVYYDLLTNQVGSMKTNTRDLIEYAFTKKVIIVSPTSFLAYLQTVLQGLKALQIEEQAQQIRKQVGELNRHIESAHEFYKKLGTSLGTVVSHYNSGHKELGKINKDVYRISGSNIDMEVVALERPLEDIDGL